MKRCCYSTQALADLSAGGIVDVPLAQTGEGIAECELLKWFVEEVSSATFAYSDLFHLHIFYHVKFSFIVMIN